MSKYPKQYCRYCGSELRRIKSKSYYHADKGHVMGVTVDYKCPNGNGFFKSLYADWHPRTVQRILISDGKGGLV